MKVGVLEIELLANMARLFDDMRRAERVVGGSMEKVEKSVARASRALSSFGMGLSGALVANQLRRMSDQYIKMDAQLRNSTKSQEQYNTALADIRRISTVAQTDISATTMLYTRLINVMDGTGVSQSKLATVTETVSYGLKAYGATAAEAASASLQLSQAMGANRLGGEEFRATLEAMPNVMKVLAKSMGVPLGELRALSIAGKITAAEMVKAFGDPAIAAEFKRLALNAQTVTGAWTVARNELMLLFGEFAKSSGLTSGVIAAFNGMASGLRIMGQYIDDIVVAFGIWATIAGGRLVASLTAAWMAQMALNAAHAEALALNVAMAAADREKILADIASTQATLVATAAKHSSALAAAELSLADQRAAIAQLNHARAAGLLSGHLYIVRTVEAELVVATNQLNAATALRNSLMSRQSILNKEMIASNIALTASTAAVTRAETLAAAGSKGMMSRVLGGIGKWGIWGLVLWGAYELADALGWIDKLFDAFESRTAKAQRTGISSQVLNLNTQIMDMERMLAAQQGVAGGAAGDAYVAELKKRIARARAELQTLNAGLMVDAQRTMSQAGATYTSSTAWSDAYMTPEEVRAKKEAELKALQTLELQKAGENAAAKAKIMTEYYVKLDVMRGDAAAKDRSVMEGIRKDLEAANEAEVFGKLSAVEKVNKAWEKFTQARKNDATEIAEHEKALEAARLFEKNKQAEALSDSIMKALKSGDIGKSLFEDIQAEFEKGIKVNLQASINDLLPAGGWKAALSAAAPYVLAAVGVAVVADMFKSTSWSRSGIKGSLGPGGVSATGYTERGSSSFFDSSYSMKTYDLTARKLADLNVAFSDVKDRFTLFADQLGLSAEAVQNFTMEFDIGSGAASINDMFKSASDQMAYQMLGVDVDAITRQYVAAYNSADRPRGEGTRKWTDVMASTYSELLVLKRNGYTDGSDWSVDDADKMRADVLKLIEADLPEWFKYLRNEGESLSDALARIGGNVGLVTGLMDALGSTLFAATDVFGDNIIAMTEFVDALGGIEEATKKSNSFIQNFAPDDVLFALAQKQITDLGLPLLQTTEEWFAYAQTASEEQLIALLNNQPAIQAYLDALGEQTTATEALAKTNLSWQQKIDVLLGNRTQREVDLENALLGVDDTTALLIRQFYGLQDAADATAKALERVKINSFATLVDYNRAMALAAERAPTERAPTERAPYDGGNWNAPTYSASQTQSMLGGQDVVAELRALRAETAQLRADLRASQGAIAANTDKTQKVLAKIDKLGISTERVA